MNKTLLLSCLFILISLSIEAQIELKEVTAKKGDGIYSLLRKNGLEPTEYFKAFIELSNIKNKKTEDTYLIMKKERLWKN